jgi:poly-gamma-glutamate synthesis protein (capsule biosynthesis protein)
MLLLVALVWLGGAPVGAQPKPARDSAHPLRLGVVDGFTLTAVGDLIQTHPISAARTPGLGTIIGLLQGSSATFGNFESTAIDIREFQGFPQAEFGGLWVRSEPAVVPDLKAMGFDLVARANNHSTDWGVEGMRETNRRLDQAGIVHAGTGETRAAARAARYLGTPQGTLAVVSMASSFTPLSRSMNPVGQAPGRPGINALRTTRRVLVSASMLQALKAVAAAQPKGSYQPPSDSSPNDLDLFGVRYRVSQTVKDQLAFGYEMDSVDVREIMASIRQGKQNADFLIATIHAHEPGNWSDTPPDFLPILARATIDNGADVFVGHGPHQLRGIEIYRGRPIFYSLGNFFFQVESIEPVGMDLFEQFRRNPNAVSDNEFLDWWHRRFFGGETAPIWYQSVLAVSKYERGRVSEIRLYPVELGFAEHDLTKGVPRPAPPQLATKILENLARLSRPFGTTITIEGSVGVIRVDGGTTSTSRPNPQGDRR